MPRDRRALAAVDLGAESCRVSLLRCEGDRLVAKVVHRFANAAVSRKDGLRWPLEQIERGVMDGLRRCAALAPEGMRAVAVDGWAVDYVRLSADGEALAAPFCYRDERTAAAEQSVHAKVAIEKLRALTGIQIQRINTAYQLVADRLAGEAPARWLNLPEYFLYKMSGRCVAEKTNASHTQLLELGAARWCEEAFALLGLERGVAPALVPCGTVLGPVSGELAGLTGFRDAVVIAPACHDTASAIAGIPAPAGDWAYISSGTWSLVGTVLDGPENGARAREGNYTNLAAAGGRTLFHKGLHGMWLLRQCLDHWAGKYGETIELSELIAAAQAVPRPSRMLVVDDPELLLHGRMPERIAAQLQREGGEVLPLTPDTAPRYASLIFHSLAVRYAAVLSEIAAITGRRFTCVYAVGGGSRNTFLNRLIEEETGLPVRCGPAEASTLGNFAVQLAVLENGQADAGSVARWACMLSYCNGAGNM